MSSIYDALKRVQNEEANISPPAGKPKSWSTPKNWAIIIIAVTVSSIVSMGVYSYMSSPSAEKTHQGAVAGNAAAVPDGQRVFQERESYANTVNGPPSPSKIEDPVSGAPTKSRDEYIKLANQHFDKGEYDRAALVYKEALGIYKNDAGLINNLGAVLLAQSDYDDAIRYFKIAAQCSKDYVEPVYNLACAYARKGDDTSALKELERAINMNGQDVKKWAKDDPDLKSLQGRWNSSDDNH